MAQKYLPLPAQELLTERYCYDASSGSLTWRIKSPNGRRRPGDPVGHFKSDGRLTVKISGTWYLGHRLIWRMVTGEDPGDLEIDHKDRNPRNNRFDNLRLATHNQNSFNRISRIRTEQLPRGVARSGNKFRARIVVDRSWIYLGLFDTAEAAHHAYLAAARKHAGEFAFSGANN